LEEINAHGIFHIDVAVVFEFEPSDMGDSKFVFALTMSMFKVSYHKKSTTARHDKIYRVLETTFVE
jgi:hypothetical protein